MQNDKSYWGRWYVWVIAFLIVQIIVFYCITKEFV